MSSLLHLGRQKFTSFVLQKKNGSVWEQVEEYPASTYKQSPKFEEVESLLDEGETYRTAIIYPGHDPVPDARLGTWQKRIKAASGKKTASTDVGKQIRESLAPATEAFTALGDLFAAIDTLRYGPAPEAGTQTGQPAARPETPFERIKSGLQEYADVKDTMKRLGLESNYDPAHPQYPPIAFNGTLPAWMHPTALSFSKDFIKDVLGSLGETAQEFGFRFRQGLNGQGPKAALPEVAAPAVNQATVVKSLLEAPNPEEVAYIKKIEKLVATAPEKPKPEKKEPEKKETKPVEKPVEKKPEIVTIAPEVK